VPRFMDLRLLSAEVAWRGSVGVEIEVVAMVGGENVRRGEVSISVASWGSSMDWASDWTWIWSATGYHYADSVPRAM
jgi:hypothetical protein